MRIQQQPIMQTLAQQAEINQVRLDAEMNHARLLAAQQAQQVQFADFVTSSLRRDEQRQPHVIYNTITGSVAPPPPPPPPTAVTVNPMMDLEAMARRVREEKERSEEKLHEVTASARQSVNQHVIQLQGEFKRAVEQARLEEQARARGRPGSSTDPVQPDPSAQLALLSQLREVKEAAASAQSRVTAMQGEWQDLFDQQMANEVERVRRKKKAGEALAVSSNSQPPPPPPGPAKVKKGRVVTFAEDLPRTAPSVLPLNNPAQNTPSHQPSGAQVPGPRSAVMPNTGASMPAHPTPTVNNTREDDKPLKKSMREGASPAVRKKIRDTSEAKKEKQGEGRRRSRLSGSRRRRRETPLHRWGREPTM